MVAGEPTTKMTANRCWNASIYGHPLLPDFQPSQPREPKLGGHRCQLAVSVPAGAPGGSILPARRLVRYWPPYLHHKREPEVDGLWPGALHRGACCLLATQLTSSTLSRIFIPAHAGPADVGRSRPPAVIGAVAVKVHTCAPLHCSIGGRKQVGLVWFTGPAGHSWSHLAAA